VEKLPSGSDEANKERRNVLSREARQINEFHVYDPDILEYQKQVEADGEKEFELKYKEKMFYRRLGELKHGERHIEIIGLRRQGYEIKEIAAMYGKSYGWVHKQLATAMAIAAAEFGVHYLYRKINGKLEKGLAF
jgi:hypothetical protein